MVTLPPGVQMHWQGHRAPPDHMNPHLIGCLAGLAVPVFYLNPENELGTRQGVTTATPGLVLTHWTPTKASTRWYLTHARSGCFLVGPCSRGAAEELAAHPATTALDWTARAADMQEQHEKLDRLRPVAAAAAAGRPLPGQETP